MRSWHLLILLLLVVAIVVPSPTRAQKDLFEEDESLDELDLLEEEETPKKPHLIKEEQKPTPPAHTHTPIKEQAVIEEDDEFPVDDDEFEGHETSHSKSKKEKIQTPKPKTPPKVTVTFAPSSSYWPEISALILLVIYGINYLYGRSRNDTIANQWLLACTEPISTHFAATGIEQLRWMMEIQEKSSVDDSFRAGHVAPPTIRTSPTLTKDSASCYKLYVTGRRFCTGMLVTLELRKRQDLLSWIFEMVDLSPTQDTVTLEIPMSDEDMDPFVFAIVRKKNEKTIRKMEKDIENYATLVKSTQLPATLCVLTDAPELEQDFIDERVARTLTELEPYFISLHFSDQTTSSFTVSKKVLRYTFRIPTTVSEMDHHAKLIRMALHLIDRVGTYKLTTGMKTRADNKRKLVADRAYKATHQQRQEEVLRRKAELKKKESENAPPLSAEAQRRKEEREYKQQQKKMKPRVKMVR